jgi:hypothetical protein
MSLIKKFAVKTVKVEDLKEWEINPRIHSEKGLYDVKASISKFGMAALMYCDSDLTIIGGHARKKVLIELGVEEVKCWVAKKKLPEKEFKALALLSNQIFSSFNQQKVNEMTDPFSLLDIGFDAAEVDFDEDIELEEDDLDNTSGKEKSHRILLKFGTEDDRMIFEQFLVELREKYPDVETNAERFINYLKEEL